MGLPYHLFSTSVYKNCKENFISMEGFLGLLCSKYDPLCNDKQIYILMCLCDDALINSSKQSSMRAEHNKCMQFNNTNVKCNFWGQNNILKSICDCSVEWNLS